MAACRKYQNLLLGLSNVLTLCTFMGIVFMFVVSCSFALEEGDVEGYNPAPEEELQFCTFFNNRAPEIQPDLENCTWFRDNSCCRQIEIDVTFRKMKSLPGASKQCQRYINYLMCYICSPRQHRFYIQQRLTVCEEFCDAILYHCKTAWLKGSQIGDLYSRGREFCKSRRLYVGALETGKCFYFNESMDTTLTGSAPRKAIVSTGYPLFSVLFSALLVTLNLTWR